MTGKSSVGVLEDWQDDVEEVLVEEGLPDELEVLEGDLPHGRQHLLPVLVPQAEGDVVSLHLGGTSKGYMKLVIFFLCLIL